MKLMRELMSATFVATGLALMCGAGLVAMESAAMAARGDTPVVVVQAETCTSCTASETSRECANQHGTGCTTGCMFCNSNKCDA